jgi:cell division septation protein DedD
MEDQTTWRGHTFTLLVFVGIVVLSSIFFILGMLVGRAQGQKTAAAASAGPAVKTDAKPVPKEDDFPGTLYDPPKKDDPVTPPPPLPKAESQIGPANSAKKIEPFPDPSPPPGARSNAVNYQIAALTKLSDAEKLVKELKKKAFPAFILAPPGDGASPLFRVLVGPFEDLSEAHDAKKRLEAARYQPILKK